MTPPARSSRLHGSIELRLLSSLRPIALLPLWYRLLCRGARRESCLLSRFFTPQLLLLYGFSVLLLVACPGESISEGHGYHGRLIARQQCFGVLRIGYGKAMLSNQLHGSGNRDAHLTARAIDPTVVVEQ